MPYIGKTQVDSTTYPIGSTLYGTCSTTANTVNKTVTLSDFDTLMTGVTLHVKFTYSNTASNPKLIVGSEGQAKPIYKYGTTVPGTTTATSWPAGAIVSFTYTGDAWIMNDWNNTDTWTAMTGATSAADGSGGYINATPPKDGYNTKFWRADGTWAIPTDNNTDTYVGSAAFADDSTSNAANPVKMTLTYAGTNAGEQKTANIPKVSSSSAGVAPKGATVSTQIKSTKFLREDGSWAAPSYGTTWYGTSSTTASTTAKVVTCSGFELTTGAIIGVLFSTANTAATPTLNVNSTGAKTIYVGGNTALNATDNVLKWSANTMVYFMYDGTYYRYITSVSAGTVAPSRGANTWYGTSSTTAATAAKTSTIDNFVLTKGAVVLITFSTANTYTSGAISLNVNSTGAKNIYYNNAVTSSTNALLWNAGETLIFIYSGNYYYYAGKSISKVSQLTNDSGYITSSSLPTVTQSADTGITIDNHASTSIGSASGWNAGSFTSGNFNGGSGDFTATVNNHIMSFSHTHTAATHATDSFTAPSLTITSTTVTTGTTHKVNDNGHTHSI